MKNPLISLVLATALSAGVLVACNFNDPLLDGNGEKVNLVRLDLPKFDARYTIRIVDVNGNPINDATVGLEFAGKDSHNLITDVGNIVMKESSPEYIDYRTAKYGILGINLNPNFKVASHPVKFQVNGIYSEKEEYIIIPKIVTQTVAGDLTTHVTAVKLPEVSHNGEPYAADALTVGGAKATKITSLNTQSGNGYNIVALYRSNESTEETFTCLRNGKSDSDYGIYLLGEDMTITPRRSRVVIQNQYFILAEKPSGLIEGKLRVDVNSELKGVATSVPYAITSSDGTQIACGSISGTMPFSATIEQVFVSESNSTVNIALSNGTTYAVTPQLPQKAVISASDVPSVNFNIGTNNVASADLRRCDISVAGICNSNKQIALYPTIRFLYTQKDANRWEWAESKAGKIVLMLEQSEDYSIRIPINNVWQEFGITTNQDKIQAMVRDQPNVSKFELTDNSDGSMNLKVEYRDQEFCDLSL